ncbi:glycosyltransferase [Sphingomonas sp. CBMAI 2297]|uniref:glycosyltransferase n=1 Tax=Sphingomonas sp. CBMAI 2297 TaxID=2991720 RepID=UPI002453F889|nr:glycosyltransferase [Sphingomonas sp. CBMAI 2297]MDH4746631.1 glycosyltransferase [Sphingomonas sp. CBMAI 2297]
MMRIVHLLDDFALGGVTKSFRIFEHPMLAEDIRSDVVEVAPRRQLAPSLAADVILTHFPPSWAALPFIRTLRLRNPRARLVHVEHSYCAAWERLKVPSLRRFHAMLRLALPAFDHVVTVSDGQRRWLSGVCQPRAISTIRPWSGEERLYCVPPPMPAQRLTVGAYGRFAEQKGFDTLIRAMHRLDPERFSLHLGGFGPDEAMLRALAGNAPHIRFLGKLDDPGVLLANVDLVVVPSRWEPFGQVAAEAKLAGRATLLADVDGLPEQSVAGLVSDCTSPELLAEAIERMAGMDLRDMGRRNRAAMVDAGHATPAAWRALLDHLVASAC